MILGITGGVGSGKSTVLKYLKSRYNAYIIEADIVAKEIMNPGTKVYRVILEQFQDLKVDSEGLIDRQNLASIVFNDNEKLDLLNSIVHPGVKEEIKSRIAFSKKSDEGRLVVIEAALLIEDGYKAICDVIWYVFCEKEERIRRLRENRGYSREKSIEIINNQLTEEEFKANTDAFVDNTFGFEETNRQIDILLRKAGYKMQQFTRNDRKIQYKGAIIDVYKDYITTPEGNHAEWDFIGHKGAAAVLPVMEDGNILMVRQWRNAIDRFALEIPAGGKDGINEPTAVCAARELEEETGYKSDDIEFLQTIVPAIAYSEETIDIYLARNLVPSKQNLDPDEYINVEKYPIEDLIEMIYKNEIQDSKTVAAIMTYYCKYCAK